MLMVQSWPQSTCLLNTDKECAIPAGVDGFVIHGSWPSNNDTSYPSFCNKDSPTYKFNEDDIKDIEDELVKKWPNLFVQEGKTSFWKHEWEKHGDCAVEYVPRMTNEHDYFAVTMEVTSKYDLLAVLERAGVSPSPSKTYNTSDFVNAIVSGLGVKPVTSCARTGQYVYLEQIGLCFDNDLVLIHCDSRVIGDASCRVDDVITFPPKK